jgi:predicted dehydrogenase
VQETLLQKGVIPGGKEWGTEPDSEKGLLHTEVNGKEVREYISSERGDYNDYYDAIFESIRHGKPLPVTAGEGREVIRVIETAFESNRLQRVVEPVGT